MVTNIHSLYTFTSNTYHMTSNLSVKIDRELLTENHVLLEPLINDSGLIDSNKILITTNEGTIATSDIHQSNLDYLLGLTENVSHWFADKTTETDNIVIDTQTNANIETNILNANYQLIEQKTNNLISSSNTVVSEYISILNVSNIQQGVRNKYIVNDIHDSDLIINNNLVVLNTLNVSNITELQSKTILNESLRVRCKEDIPAFTIRHNTEHNIATITTSTDQKSVVISSLGSIGLGVTEPTEGIDVLGDINCTGLYSNSQPFSYYGLSNIPSEFPPSPHEHSVSEINGLEEELNAKQDIIPSLILGDNSITIDGNVNLISDTYQFRKNNENLGSSTSSTSSSKWEQKITKIIEGGIDRILKNVPDSLDKYYVFETTSGTNSITFVEDTLCDILLIGGGGGGGANAGGGGNAGELIFETSVVMKGTYLINVGTGGQAADYDKNRVSSSGNNTTILQNNGFVFQVLGGNGGSDGDSNAGNGGYGTGNQGTFAVLDQGGNGGDGKRITIIDTNTFYAGGGRGGSLTGTSGVSGLGSDSYGGGGNGANVGNDGVTNGRDGVVIIRVTQQKIVQGPTMIYNDSLILRDLSSNIMVYGENQTPYQMKYDITETALVYEFEYGSNSVRFPFNTQCDILLVGGGGGASGSELGKNGNPGNLIYVRDVTVPVGNYDIIVGDGGREGMNGGDTIAFGGIARGGMNGDLGISNSSNSLLELWELTKEITIDIGTIKIFPPVNLVFDTADTNKVNTVDKIASTSLSGQSYGDGEYIVEWSSDSYDAYGYTAFTGGSPHSGGNTYDSTTSISTYTNRYIVSNYWGEWIKIKLPVAIYLKYVTLVPRSGHEARFPVDYKIYGTNNGNNWIEIIHHNHTTYSGSTSVQKSPDNDSVFQKFNEFAIVIHKIYNAGSTNSNFYNFNGLALYGTDDIQKLYPSHSTSTVMLNNNLRVWYKFSAPNGKIDSSSYFKNTTSIGLPILDNETISITADNYLKLPSDIIDFDNDITISFWYRFDNDNAGGRLVDIGMSNGISINDNNIVVSRDTSQNTQLTFIIDTKTANVEFGHITNGPLIHVTWIIKKDGTWMIYKNNEKIHEELLSYPSKQTYLHSYLGKSNYLGEFDDINNISLKDFRIYDKALSNKEIGDVYNGYRTTSLAMTTSSFSQTKHFIDDKTNMLAWYKFDGDFTDSSGNGKHLTGGTGTTFVDDRVVGTNSINFPNNDGQELSSAVDLSGNKSFSISFWSYRNSNGEHDYIISSGIAQTNKLLTVGYIFDSTNSSDSFAFAFYGNDLFITNYQENDTGRWIHFTVTYDISNLHRAIYRNGILIANDVASNSLNIPNNSSFIIGTRYNSVRPFGGKLDDVRIYNRALTQEEIATLYSQTIPSSLKDMLVWYKFNGDFTDSSGNGNDLTNTDCLFDSSDVIANSQCVSFTGSSYLRQSKTIYCPQETTISFWGYFTGNGWSQIISTQSGADGWLIQISNANTLRIFISNNQPDVFTFGASGFPSYNQWFHFVLVLNSVTNIHHAYVNGILVKTFSVTYIPVTQSLSIGTQLGTPAYFLKNGEKLDDVRIYNCALTQREVNALYLHGSISPKYFIDDNKDMLAWYKFDGNGNDSSGNGNDLLYHTLHPSTGAAITALTPLFTNIDTKVGISSFYNDITRISSRWETTNEIDFTPDITICMWLKINYENQNNYDVALHSKTSPYNLKYHAGNSSVGNTVVGIVLNGDSTTYYGTDSNVFKADSNWHFHVLTGKKNTNNTLNVNLYLDNILIETWLNRPYVNKRDRISIMGYPLLGSSTTTIDGVSSRGHGVIGNISDLRIYNRVLTQEEIATLYTYSDLNTNAVWYKFSQDNNGRTDSSGNARNALSTGTPQISQYGEITITKDDYLIIPYNVIDHFKDICVSCFYRFDLDDSQRIVEFDTIDNANSFKICRVANSSSLIFIVDNRLEYKSEIVIDFGHTTGGKMTHVTWNILKNGKWIIYRDGVEVYRGLKVYPKIATYNKSRLGKSTQPDDETKECSVVLKDFRVYNRMLVESEVQFLADSKVLVAEIQKKEDTTALVPIRYNNEKFTEQYGLDYNYLTLSPGIGYGAFDKRGGRGAVIVRIPYIYMQPKITVNDIPNQVPTNIPGTKEWYFAFTSTTGTNSITFDRDTICDVLIVAGGGSGGSSAGGGGGAGGLIYENGINISSGTYNIIVGQGGISGGTNDTRKGGNSIFSTYTAIGGGSGQDMGYQDVDYKDGGSGGGGERNNTSSFGTGGYLGGKGTLGQGNDGGQGKNFDGGNSAGGGGGGAGTPGSSAYIQGRGGDGGSGLQIPITGDLEYYAGGGGGGSGSSFDIAGTGGIGGGGNGAITISGTMYEGENGVNGTGGGGGGGSSRPGNGASGGNGGSGIVIIKWKYGHVNYSSGVQVESGDISTVSGNITTIGGNVVTNSCTVNNDIIVNTHGYDDKKWKIYGINDNQFDLSFDNVPSYGSKWKTTAKIRGNGGTKGYINFTGVHHCIAADSSYYLYDDKYIGYIVSSTSRYKSMNSSIDEKNIGMNIDKNAWDALPVVALASEKDKKVFGVISKVDDTYPVREEAIGNVVTYFEKKEYDRRLHIAGVGEGCIWVCDYNNTTIESGDFITSSPIPGIGMRQDDDLVHSYTVGKATMDCDFDPKAIPVKILSSSDNTVYIDLLDNEGNVVYEDEYEVKYVSNDGTIIDKEEYKSNPIENFRMAFIGCSYTCS